MSEASPPVSIDLSGLKARLQDTRAIGFFGRLMLKRQIEALAAQHPPSRTEFDTLINKICVLLHDDDPELAKLANDSREAMWAKLVSRGANTS